MSLTTTDLTAYLNDYLRLTEVADSTEAMNGLQVDNFGSVTRIAAAVDACQAVIDRVADSGADFLLVHHGLFWGGLQSLTGRHGRRLRRLIECGIAVYSAHIPLDVHPDVGNNAVLARALGVEAPDWFGDYHGERLGIVGQLDLSLQELVGRVHTFLGIDPYVIAEGPNRVSRVGIISGGGGSMIGQARDAGADTYVTGEGKHHTYFDAEEWGMNVIYAGHYATETVGVKALAAHLADRFDLAWDFIDHPTGL